MSKRYRVTVHEDNGGWGPFVGLLLLLLIGWGMAQSNSPQSSQQPPTPQPKPAPNLPSPPQPSPPDPQPAQSPDSPYKRWDGSYKFDRVPDSEYPDSCAFSRTDSAGQQTLDKSQLDFWACRDVGGDADSGYSVVWSDGKQTTYKFHEGGDGEVIGTNGASYPLQWRNDVYQDTQVIVITHQDGAMSLIPGHVN